MPSQAVDDDAVHFGKLLGSEVIDPSLDLAPWRAVVPGGSVVGWFEDAGRFLVQDYPAVGEGVTRGFEDGGVCLTASKSAARILAFSEPAVESPRSK